MGIPMIATRSWTARSLAVRRAETDRDLKIVLEISVFHLPGWQFLLDTPRLISLGLQNYSKVRTGSRRLLSFLSP